MGSETTSYKRKCGKKIGKYRGAKRKKGNNNKINRGAVHDDFGGMAGLVVEIKGLRRRLGPPFRQRAQRLRVFEVVCVFVKPKAVDRVVQLVDGVRL